LALAQAWPGRAARRGGLVRTKQKHTDELAFRLSCWFIDIEALTRQEGPCVFNDVNPCWFDIDVVKPAFANFAT
jgi:hypothetical protein